LTRAAPAAYIARFRGIRPGWAAETPPNDLEEIEMPKMKTKSGAKKRFKVTATGRVKVQQAGKRHGMIKRTNKFIRNARGTTVLSPQDEKIVKQFLPYA
jgi:large subunit ribosomal protein L35